MATQTVKRANQLLTVDENRKDERVSAVNRNESIDFKWNQVKLTVVKHAVAAVDFGVELTDHAGEENHTKSGDQEHAQQPIGESPKLGVFNGRSGTLNDKDNQDNHELTSKDVAIEVVALVHETGAAVRPLVGILEEVFVNRSQTDNGSLSSFDHGQPCHGTKQDDHGKHRVHAMSRPFRLFSVDETQNDDDTEHQEDGRVDVLEHLKRGVSSRTAGSHDERSTVVVSKRES